MAFTTHQLVIFAARAGNIPALRERVRSGGDVNHIDPSHGAPLMAAIRAGKLSAAAWLIENGADVNAKYGDQVGPLEVALYHPEREMVGLLLRAGARLRKKTRPHYAARLKECLIVLGRTGASASTDSTDCRKVRGQLANKTLQPMSRAAKSTTTKRRSRAARG